MLQFLDLFFLTFHTTWMLFNLFGWIHRRTRRWHLLTLSLTLLSWVGMGYWYGWGYCICTDWHWQVLRELGERDLPYSYISYLVERISGYRPPSHISDTAAVLGLIIPFCITLYLELRKQER